MFKKTTEWTEMTQMTEYSPLPLRRWWDQAVDHAVSWGEKIWLKWKKVPSLRAREEYLEYYNGLYHTSGPDFKKLERLIRRNGVPEWPNPFPEGMPEHYQLHPDGFLMADLLAVLEDWKEGLMSKELNAEEERLLKALEDGQWLKMQEQLEWQEIQALKKHREWRKLGLVQWGFYLSHQAGPFTLLNQKVHPHNIEVALHHVLNHREWLEQHGLDVFDLLKKCIANQMLTTASAQKWKKQWAHDDQHKKNERDRLKGGSPLRKSASLDTFTPEAESNPETRDSKN